MMKIGKQNFDFDSQYYIMGILNVTPDSFSDGGKYTEMSRALRHVEQMMEEGMDILDVGGESTRPGYTKISDEEEIARITPIIEKIKSEFNIPISLDTYKAAVAREGIKAGADLINDIWGLKYDPQQEAAKSGSETMAQVIAGAGVPCCLMHNRTDMEYGSFMQDVVSDLQETLQIAERAGIEKQQIMLDPGVGFAKTYEQNLEVIAKLEQLGTLGCPVLLGTSRKSVIGLTLNLPAAERVEGTAATTVYGALHGAHIFRVHDVKENKRALQMVQAIMGWM